MKTLTGSSVRARSATGQVSKSLGKNFDINGNAAGVNMEVLKISKPIVSAGKMVRSGRRIVLDEHDSFIEDTSTGKRILVELTRGDVFEISAYMSSNSHGLPKKSVLICPNEVVEAEDPAHEELDESMPEPDAVPRGVAVPETPSDKDREAHELTHLTTQPWCSVCVRATGVDERHLRWPAGERAEAQGVDHMPVIQFDYAYLSSVNEKGEQVRMRTILDTSTGYGTACVIDVKGGGDLLRFRFSRNWSTHDFDAGRIPSLRSRHWWIRSSSVCQTIALSSKSCQMKQFPRVMRVWVLWRGGTIFCKDKFELCDSTSKNGLGQSLVLLISACRGL